MLTGSGHRLAGIGPVAAADSTGERIAVTGHRAGAALDRAVVEVLAELGVTAELVPGRAVAGVACRDYRNDVVALTTAPEPCRPA